MTFWSCPTIERQIAALAGLQRRVVPAFGKTPEQQLLDGHALSEVSRLVNVATAQDGHLAGEQLQRNARRDGTEHELASAWILSGVPIATRKSRWTTQPNALTSRCRPRLHFAK